MVGRNGIGDILHQHSLTGLGLGHDEGTLTFTDRREEINHTNAGVGGLLVAAECEFLFREEWGEVLESHTVANF